MISVLFLCPKNDGLSQIAEALLNKHGHSHFKATSAGFETGEINPLVKQALKNIGVDPETYYSKTIWQFRDVYFDYIIWLGQDITFPGLPVLSPGKAHLGCWHMKPLEWTTSPDVFLNDLSKSFNLIQTRVQLAVLSHHEYELLPGESLTAVG